MKETFRQSMAWLHTWTGLILGWVLVFVFLTGTLGYLNYEIDRWMKPELPPPAVISSLAALELAVDRLNERASEAKVWHIYFPGSRDSANLSVSWETWPADGETHGEHKSETLDARTGTPIEAVVRETGGGMTLYAMHYALHYFPYQWAIRIVGAATMFMAVAIVTGIVVHKKIFKDFFTFRPAKGQRSWLDGHNLLSVAALPFHVMITWSGLIFFLDAYMPAAIETLYPDAVEREAFYAEAYGYETPLVQPALPVAQLTGLGPLLAQAESAWGEDGAGRITVGQPGRADARVTIYSRYRGISGDAQPLFFDGISGALLSPSPDLTTGPGRFSNVMLGLHEGRFAGPLLRALYVIAGLTGTGMIATGLVLWTTKRKAKLAKTGDSHFGIALVEHLNAGTIIGLPVGIAAYFWANRLIPVSMAHRAEWEVHTLFIVWGLTYLFAICRPFNRAWFELSLVAAAAYGLIPFLNALTTDRGLAASISHGDWVFAGFDLSAFGAGCFFLFLARQTRRKRSSRQATRKTATDGGVVAAARVK